MDLRSFHFSTVFSNASWAELPELYRALVEPGGANHCSNVLVACPFMKTALLERAGRTIRLLNKGLWLGLCLNYRTAFGLKLAATTEVVSARPS